MSSLSNVSTEEPGCYAHKAEGHQRNEVLGPEGEKENASGAGETTSPEEFMGLCEQQTGDRHCSLGLKTQNIPTDRVRTA